MSDIKELIIWGGTGQAKVLIELILGTPLNLVAMVDNRVINPTIFSVPILMGDYGLDEWLKIRISRNRLLGAVAIGGPRGGERLRIMESLKEKNIHITTLIHRTSFIAADSKIGEGCQILANTSICTHVQLGRGVIVNTSASIDHDCIVGDGAHIGPSATLAGEIKIGNRSFIGAGSVILPRITIGDDVIVGAGSVVLRDILNGEVVAGNPAKPI